MLTRIEDPEEFSLDLAPISFYCIEVGLQDAAGTIARMNDLFPMTNCRHLKRIRRVRDQDLVRVLVSRVGHDPDEAAVVDATLRSAHITFDALHVVDVPGRHPLTRLQYDCWNAHWPLVFHESMVERQRAKQLEHYTALFMQWSRHFEQNAVSLLVVENSTSSELPVTHIAHESRRHDMSCPTHEGKYPFDHLVMHVLNSPPKHERTAMNGRIPYLLSGCVAIMSVEPCTMCAMALLHSRIDAAIYFHRNEHAGALGSLCLLHVMSELNHRFPVYRVDNKD